VGLWGGLATGPGERCKLPQWGPPAAKGFDAFVFLDDLSCYRKPYVYCASGPTRVGLPDVRQKEDMSSFLKSCPPSGRHWLYMEKCPPFLSVTDLPTLLVAMAQYYLYCVYRFNRKLTVAVDFLSIYPVGLLSYFVTCSLQVLFDYLNLNKRQMENFTLTRRLFCPPL